MMLGISVKSFCLMAILFACPNRAVALDKRHPAALRRAGGAFLVNTSLPRPPARSSNGYTSTPLRATGSLLAFENKPSITPSSAAFPGVSVAANPIVNTATANATAHGNTSGMPTSLTLPSGAVMTEVVNNGTTQRAALVAFEQTSTVLHVTQSVMTLVGKPAVTSIVAVTIAPSSYIPPPSPTPVSPSAAPQPKPSGDLSAQAWVKEHNDARKQYGAADLTWRDDLVAKAQSNAKLCTGQHRCVRALDVRVRLIHDLQLCR